MAKNFIKASKKINNKKLYCCSIFIRNKHLYTSSSLGRHLRTVHCSKWVCQFCYKSYADKNSHKICFQKEKFLLSSFIDNLKNNVKEKISFSSTSLNYSFLFEDYGLFFYSQKLKLGNGHFSNVFYGIDKSTQKEIAIKFPRNPNKICD